MSFSAALIGVKARFLSFPLSALPFYRIQELIKRAVAADVRVDIFVSPFIGGWYYVTHLCFVHCEIASRILPTHYGFSPTQNERPFHHSTVHLDLRPLSAPAEVHRLEICMRVLRIWPSIRKEEPMKIDQDILHVHNTVVLLLCVWPDASCSPSCCKGKIELKRWKRCTH